MIEQSKQELIDTINRQTLEIEKLQKADSENTVAFQKIKEAVLGYGDDLINAINEIICAATTRTGNANKYLDRLKLVNTLWNLGSAYEKEFVAEMRKLNDEIGSGDIIKS